MAPVADDDIVRKGEAGSSSDSPVDSIKEKEAVEGGSASPNAAEWNEVPRQQSKSAKRGGSLGALEPGEEMEFKDGKRILTQKNAYESLGYCWPRWKKWMLLSSIFAVQVSMNFNSKNLCLAIGENWPADALVQLRCFQTPSL